MTDYNDGKWHGQNGGECPVHPKSHVHVLTKDGGNWTDVAACGVWGAIYGAFRVVKAYREPRECWSYGAHLHDTLADAENFRADVDASNPGRGYLDHPITKWVEVLP